MIIKPNDLKKDIASFNLGQTREEQDMKNGWTWLTEKNICVDNKFFIFAFVFFDNRLKEIHITFQDKKFDLTQNWDIWSEEKELNKLKQFKTWVNQKLGTQDKFDWGTVDAVYDSKGATSSIILRYK